MTVVERIIQHVKSLPESIQTEVLDFVEYLEGKVGTVKKVEDRTAWARYSLSQAMRGLESEPSSYTEGDLKEVFS